MANYKRRHFEEGQQVQLIGETAVFTVVRVGLRVKLRCAHTGELREVTRNQIALPQRAMLSRQEIQRRAAACGLTFEQAKEALL